MKTELTFDDVCKFVKGNLPELKEDIDALLNLLIISTSFLICPGATALAAIAVISDLLGVKDGISKIGERVFKAVTDKLQEDSVDKYYRMQVAYVLICYSAFFDALDYILPDVMKDLKLKPSEKKLLSVDAIEALKKRKIDPQDEYSFEEFSPEIVYKEFALPHPADSFETEGQFLLPLYKELSQGFAKFIESLALWEKASPKKREKITKSLADLPTQAVEHFEAQYYNLATKFEEFFIWTYMREQKLTKAKLKKMSDYLKKYSEVAASSVNLDIGMKNLSDLVNLIPVSVNSHQENKAIQELKILYKSRIDEPIISDIGEAHIKKGGVLFPPKGAIFVPQAFQVIRYSGERLEDDATWDFVSIRDDLDTFLLAYLSSPYSEKSPLIILGHPGSGKSMLTQIISARLAESPYTPIRVTLRDINAESEIPVQIEEQIKRDSGREVTWAGIADAFNNAPPLIILDGYDELLQASGKVHSGYLRKVQKFQENEMQLGRQSVRAIATSRITLIDKADIPQDATVIRLRPFDEDKRKLWTSVWNKTNISYFEKSNVKQFVVPKSGKLLELATQPLLLLMLALYDSAGNQLQNSQELDQSVLYDSLLRRFIIREKLKDEKFYDLPDDAKNVEIELEMERLGVAAMGMFNRRKLNIRIEEINQDLNFFNLVKTYDISAGAALSQADLLLGSFFFVHESKSQNTDLHTNKQGSDLAFEFLHNTFGEFLTTDFMIRKVLKECLTLVKLKSAGLEELRHIKLNKSEDFPVVCFAFTPLFSRPVILGMMQEWINHQLIRYNLVKQDFLRELDALINAEMQRLLSRSRLSSVVIQGNESIPFPSLSNMGQIALYSINLILLRTALAQGEYIFDESAIDIEMSGPHSWDKLISLWHSWFSVESLEGITAVLLSSRSKNKVHLRLKQNFIVLAATDRLNSVFNVASTLSDDILAGVTGLLKYDSYRDDPSLLMEINTRLELENINLRVEVLIRRLRSMQNSLVPQDLYNFINGEIIPFLSGDHVYDSNVDSVLNLLQESMIIADKYFGVGRAIEIFDSFYARKIERLADMPGLVYPTAFELGLRFKNDPFLRWFRDDFARSRRRVTQEAFVSVLRLAIKFNDEPILKYFGERYLESNSQEALIPLPRNEITMLALVLGDRMALEKFIQNYEFETMELNYYPPQIIIEVLRAVRRFYPPEFLYKFIEHYLENFRSLGERSNFEYISEDIVLEILHWLEHVGPNGRTSRIFRELDNARHTRSHELQHKIETMRKIILDLENPQNLQT